ncbi:hypothetical protein ACOSP7_028759 [Xanthoceras sorbifolium]
MGKQHEKDQNELHVDVKGRDGGGPGLVTLHTVVQGTQAGKLLQTEEEVETVTKVGFFPTKYSSQQVLSNSRKGQGMPKLVSDVAKE